MNADSVTESFLCPRVNAPADSATGGYPAEAPALASKRFSAHGRRRVCHGGTTGFARGAPWMTPRLSLHHVYLFKPTSERPMARLSFRRAPVILLHRGIGLCTPPSPCISPNFTSHPRPTQVAKRRLLTH